MKKSKIILMILGSVVLLIIIFVLVVLLNGHYFKSKKDLKDYKNNNWMSYIKDDVKLIDIVIPGSHDAGTCSTSYLGRTQGYNIKTQLDMGTRYFDLRVNKEENEYYMYHEMFNGEKFLDVLTAITAFIKENKSETLILDFQHFKGDSELDVINFLNEYLVKDNLVVRNITSLSDLEFISNLILKDTRGKCIVLFGHNDELVSKYDYIFPRNNDACTKTKQVLNSCYISEYNKLNSKDYIEIGLPYYYQNIQNKIETELYKGLFVLQGQLTDGLLIFGPYSKEKTHHKNMTKYIKDIKNDPYKLSLTNIIMRDFLTYEKCEDIIALNSYKNNVKEEYQSTFDDLYVLIKK